MSGIRKVEDSGGTQSRASQVNCEVLDWSVLGGGVAFLLTSPN